MTFLDILGLVAGLVLSVKAGEHIEQMSRRSNHFVRVAYYALAVGGAALVLAPIAKDADWMKPLGGFLVVGGAALLFAFDRRREDRRETPTHG